MSATDFSVSGSAIAMQFETMNCCGYAKKAGAESGKLDSLIYINVLLKLETFYYL